MKRFFAAVLLGLFVAGCSKVVPEQQGSSVPVSVVPAVTSVKSQGSKALVNNGTELQQYPISLIGSFTRNSTTTEVFGNAKLSCSSGAWGYTGGTQYWIPGSLYRFAAFAPYAYVTTDGVDKPANSLSNGRVSYDNSTRTLQISEYNTGKTNSFDARCEDLLYASVTRDNTLSDDYSPVALQMNHLLACLEFSVRNATEKDIVSVYNISLEGVKYKCTIKIDCMNAVFDSISDDKSTADIFSGAERSPETGQTSFLPKGMSSTSYKHLFDCVYLTVLHQDVYGIDQDEMDSKDENIYLNFTVHYKGENASNDVTYKVNLSNIDSVMKWEMGRKYSYNLTITSQNIYFQVVEVPWVEHKVELK